MRAINPEIDLLGMFNHSATLRRSPISTFLAARMGVASSQLATFLTVKDTPRSLPRASSSPQYTLSGTLIHKFIRLATLSYDDSFCPWFYTVTDLVALRGLRISCTD